MFLVHIQRLPSLKKHLADSTLQSLAEAFESHTYDAGDVITIAGKPADRIFVVKSGGCVLSQVAARALLGSMSTLAGPFACGSTLVIGGKLPWHCCLAFGPNMAMRC